MEEKERAAKAEELKRAIKYAIEKIDHSKVSRLILAMNDSLKKIDFPFSAIELGVACDYLVMNHIRYGRPDQKEPQQPGVAG